MTGSPAARISSLRLKVVAVALLSRIVLLLAMSISCAIIPDLYPGDDVKQFDLRLLTARDSASGAKCFCLRGHACDLHAEKHSSRRGNWLIDSIYDRSRRQISHSVDQILCADEDGIIFHHQKSNTMGKTMRYTWLDSVYMFILPPVTKWDSARFLSLSVDPWARYPPSLQVFLNEDNKVGCGSCDWCNTDDERVCNNEPKDLNKNYEELYYPSEQSHAFMPLIPLLIRHLANFLVCIIQPQFLPPTYEATAALAAIILNISAFIIASIALYDLTRYMLMGIYILDESACSKKISERKSISKVASRGEGINQQWSITQLSNITAQLFCINPAGVFFTVAYSESVFAMLTFSGHAIAAKMRYNKYIMEVGNQRTKSQYSSFGTFFSSLLSIFLWMAASYARSNGMFSSIWLIILAFGNCCSFMSRNEKQGRNSSTLALRCTLTIAWHLCLALMIAAPVFYHDWRGYYFHCVDTPHPHDDTKLLPRPAWCSVRASEKKFTFRTFALYAYVQRKHWNVGFMRYFELKQIPNFILAAPVLIISYCAALAWIFQSWKRHNCEIGTTRGESNIVIKFFKWVFHALRASSYYDLFSYRYERSNAKGNGTDEVENIFDSWSDILLGPSFLPYYAILAGFALVGTFLAHVQISTRLICSSCPAFYWFTAVLMTRKNDPVVDSSRKDSDAEAVTRILGTEMPRIVYCFFALYNVLGAVMHVNWLPWT